jgi:D-alanyl-lipoteichoic acid acyltransferase DltB (MBOAT superfamily)
MGFATAGFLAFLAVVAVVYATVPRGHRCLVLVVASYVFYFQWSGWFAVLLLCTTLLTFFAARSRSAALHATALIFLVLAFFKSLPLIGIDALIPLGVSYYTFKLAGYLVDCYWGAIEPERRLLPFLAFASFFPQIVAGPIQRAQTFLPQVERAESNSGPAVTRAALRIVLGFFKKFVIADNLGIIVNYVYSHLAGRPGAPAALGFYGYPLQMYADFSGVTDIAIGASALLGISAPENFDAPFCATSPSGYWRRWHMTLTQWMTDYVFTPLRMSLRSLGNAGLVLSLFANMILIGLWHGFYWNFAMFGVVHAVYLSVDALTQKARRRWYKRYPNIDRLTDWTGPFITFHLIAVAFVFFRADNLQTVELMFRQLLGAWGPLSPEFRDLIGQGGTSLSVLAGAWLLMEGADALRRRFWTRPLPSASPRWTRWSVYTMATLAVFFMICLLLTSTRESSPFLYEIF